MRVEYTNTRLRIMNIGCKFLQAFLWSLLPAAGIAAVVLVWWPGWLLGLLYLASLLLIENLIFWTGILTVYMTSVQLGIRWRVIGLLCGWIPVLNIWALCRIISMVKREYAFETEKLSDMQNQKNADLCKTKYPVLLIHGVFFRDSKLINYWGRVPKYLEALGAEIYFGEHSSAASVAESGREIAKKIKAIVQDTGCEKINIIAHSKGGLDARYAAACTDAKEYIASVTTVNTPHRGCAFADYLLSEIPTHIQQSVAKKYNHAAQKFGDSNPDFLAAVKDLTASACEQRNQELPDVPEIFYQSTGSKINKATSGKFPLNVTYHFVKKFDGENDGLVSVASMRWGEAFHFAAVPKGRGISHADMIDANRENIVGFDIRKFYETILSGLKLRGL